MSDQIKNQLDQIAEVIDSKIEKANGQVLENAKGQIDSEKPLLTPRLNH
jgi:predicted transcriptional regulator